MRFRLVDIRRRLRGYITEGGNRERGVRAVKLVGELIDYSQETEFSDDEKTDKRSRKRTCLPRITEFAIELPH